MVEHIISCVVHDREKRITHVGLAGEKKLFTVEKIFRLIDDGDVFFAQDTQHANTTGAKVVKRMHPKTGREYLTTNPDDIDENNLDFLLECPVPV